MRALSSYGARNRQPARTGAKSVPGSADFTARYARARSRGRSAGVDKVAVSLTHEQALVEYDPKVVRPEELLGTLRDIGYTIHDPRRLRPFEEEERELVSEGNRFVLAVALSVASIPIIADPQIGWIGFLPALVC